jgi:uncharacterized membrane protein YeaQ/YmgE (transglycosylase-associated protein family)
MVLSESTATLGHRGSGLWQVPTPDLRVPLLSWHVPRPGCMMQAEWIAYEEGRQSMGIISWIVLGAIAGFLANLLIGGGEGVIGTIILGIVGAVVGGYIASAIFHKGDVTGVNIESIVISVLGAILVLVVWRALQGNRRRA